MKLYYDKRLKIYLDLEAITAIGDVEESFLGHRFQVYLKLHDKPLYLHSRDESGKHNEFDKLQGDAYCQRAEEVERDLREAHAQLLLSWQAGGQIHKRYRHIETGNIYQVADRAIEATSGPRKGSQVVVYQNSMGVTFVRDAGEFLDKFEEVKS